MANILFVFILVLTVIFDAIIFAPSDSCQVTATHWNIEYPYINNMINSMVADTLAPCVANTSAPMIWTL